MSDTNEAVSKVAGSIASVGGLDRATVQLADTSFLTEVLGSGDALTVGIATVGVCSIAYFTTKFGVVDLDEM